MGRVTLNVIDSEDVALALGLNLRLRSDDRIHVSLRCERGSHTTRKLQTTRRHATDNQRARRRNLTRRSLVGRAGWAENWAGAGGVGRAR